MAKLTRLVPNPTFLRGLRFGVGAAVEHAEIIRALSLATVVDIGANIGQFSLLVVGLVPDVRIHAFEPLLQSARVFERLFAGNNNVVLYKYAVGRKAERLSMKVSRRLDNSSILSATPLQTEIFPGTDTVGSEMVEVVPLDVVLGPNQLLPPALLKLDVQGYELQALEGCNSVIALFSYVYIEISFVELYDGQATASELFDHLHRRGFHFKGVYNTVYDPHGLAVQCDCLFARDA